MMRSPHFVGWPGELDARRIERAISREVTYGRILYDMMRVLQSKALQRPHRCRLNCAYARVDTDRDRPRGDQRANGNSFRGCCERRSCLLGYNHECCNGDWICVESKRIRVVETSISRFRRIR
jgi:hypothetical protein